MEIALLLLLCLYLPASSGEAGRFDVYAGQPLGGDADLAVAVTDTLGTTRTSARFDPDFQGFTGLRMRGGGETWPVGLAVDLNYERTRDPRADLKLLPATAALTLPARLTLGGNPRLHPTAMAGVAWTSVGGDSQFSGSSGYDIGGDMVLPFDGSRAGFVATEGLEWQMTRTVALFGEYRYQDLRFHDAEGPGWFSSTTQASDGRFRTEGVGIGLSFRSVPHPETQP